MKHSIKTQLALSFIALMALILGANFLINNFFLEKYYIYQKEHALIDIYEKLDEVADASEFRSTEFDDEFQEISGANNVEITILSPQSDGSFQSVYQSRDNRIMRGRVEGYLFGFHVENDYQQVLVSTDNYTIQRCEDSFEDIEYLEDWGQLSSGCYFLMRIPIQSIRDNVKISNRFVTYTLFLGILVAVALIWWMSKKITEPLSELTALSKRMANLEFDAKYVSGGKNEIGQLGENFNHMSETLEKTISELKTANNELQTDLDQKIQIDEMRKEFLSNVSHELKTPIALIQGYAEGLQDCINDDAESREFYCEVIIDEAAKMNNMVKKLLSLNQLEFGNDVVNIQRFDLTELINGVIQSATLLAEQKGAQISFEQKQPLYVWGDEFKLEEVVTNYISNAINHVDGEKQIEVTVLHQNDKVRVSVFNTGELIPEDSLDKIWIKFYKVDKARTREYGGSGIGLSIVKAIMDSHHQKYGVYNRKEGVVFWFELDAADYGGENESN